MGEQPRAPGWSSTAPSSIPALAAGAVGSGIRLAFCNPALRYRFDGQSLRVQNISWEGELAAGSLEREDGIAVEIQLAGGLVRTLTLFRSPTTSDQLYYTRDVTGNLLITDHFRNALAALPRNDRELDEFATCDHFLFRTVPCDRTYCRRVARLAHGQLLEFDLEAGRSRSALVPLQTLPSGPRLDPAVVAVDEALQVTLQGMAAQAGVVNLLSGGVDSTLLQSYVGTGIPTVNWTIDSPEFEPERRYAREASALLGTRHTVVSIAEREYYDSLVDCIGALGTPPHHLQTVLLDRTMRAEPRPYLAALQADALFGLDSALRAARAWQSRTLVQQEAVRPFLPEPLARRWDARRRTLDSLLLPVADSAGFSANIGVYTELPLVKAAFGAATVERSMQRRISYVGARIAQQVTAGANPFAGQIERLQWTAFFCADTVSIWRQLAHARASSLLAPFSHQRVVSASTALKTPDRYVRRGRTKPPLKALLRRRVPAYRVDQLKGGGGLPYQRFLASGPLAGRLSDFDRPDFFSAPVWESLERTSPWTAWNALTFLVWQRAVLAADRIPQVAGTQEVVLPAAVGSTAAVVRQP